MSFLHSINCYFSDRFSRSTIYNCNRYRLHYERKRYTYASSYLLIAYYYLTVNSSLFCKDLLSSSCLLSLSVSMSLNLDISNAFFSFSSLFSSFTSVSNACSYLLWLLTTFYFVLISCSSFITIDYFSCRDSLSMDWDSSACLRLNSTSLLWYSSWFSSFSFSISCVFFKLTIRYCNAWTSSL